MVKLLLADDDARLSELVKEYFDGEGYEVTHAWNGREALDCMAMEMPDIVILDVMMPELDGFDTLKHIRAKSSVPVIMLTAKGDDIDRILGLEMGADDYLSKPFNPRELLARIKAILRRATQEKDDDPMTDIDMSGVLLRRKDRTVHVTGELVELTTSEYTLLECLLMVPGQVLTKQELSEKALGRKLTMYDRSLDMHISNLRKKIGNLESGEPRIKTVRGVGYIFVDSTDKS
ncbi:response regulator transcription factor [Marinomonas mediterranea]|jgi:two component transcriptional regulator, winged helix family|uniref:Two component transcriptional regulator, winged helix family n=1 Tax=Marinomonas mediterranea (strain ATCC 700492 / JCM 21426 / NBRC 103028 / MMB-1) TaxID=717774 RepID=F2JWK1_MARM1|nr:response regulator transcription factor [Marinomonas mediterranea]ADZ91765.1 two component transcriptional regulator, winged helix family [Marinomonas mediterranea MMB-1]WCN09722.1 response regulator [Marinomonas mediterranea]WCN13803.1 response regulator [Marinomonas mediterranea]WCN17859.1 response regulator [Marinomonas mediterranea MMB-1]